MAELSDLSPTVRAYLRFYRFRSFDWGMGARPRKPLREARIAAVTSAGLYCPEQAPFGRSPRGDCSYREIPLDTDLASLRIGQKSGAFDHAGLEADRNLALPLDRLREMRAAGEIGEVSGRHFSIMGSIMVPGPLVDETAPEIARKLREDAVDAVLLTPF